MNRLLPSLLLLSAVTALVGCPVPGGTKVSTTASTAPGAKQQPETASIVTGRVIAPANLIGQAGGNFVSTNGGTVISTGGLNVISTGGGNAVGARPQGDFRTLQAGETLIAGAEVFLADAGGNPFPSLPTVKSDTDGQYTIPNVPADLTYMVVVRFKTADGKTGQLQTLVRATKLGATADVNAASTLVTAGVVEKAKGRLGALNPAQFSRAMNLLAPHLKKESLPDWTDASRVFAAIARLKAEVAELRAELEGLQRDVEQLRSTVDELNDRISELEKSPSPTPSASPSAASPSPSVSVVPSPPATTGLRFGLEGQYSDTVNPGGAWEYMWRNDGDWQKMKVDTNALDRQSWIAKDKDAMINFGSAYIDNLVAGDGFLDMKPRSNVPVGVRWTAPQAGTLHIAVKAYLNAASTNGIQLRLMTDGGSGTTKTDLRSKEMTPAKVESLDVGLAETATVKAGDRVYLTVEANGDGEGDELRVRALLSY